MFSLIKNSLSKAYSVISGKLKNFFGLAHIDQNVLEDLRKILLESDLGVDTTKKIIETLQNDLQQGRLQKGNDLKQALDDLIWNEINLPHPKLGPIILLSGINGSGKTTSVAKLGYYYQKQNQKVLMVAADTFRAAAVEQLSYWSKQLGIDLFVGQVNQDPAAVVYQAAEKFKIGNYDVLIIDTAGRLQTKHNLMQELAKMRRSLDKILPQVPVSTLLTIDAMLGQNSLAQAREFHQTVATDGVILTKTDGTVKGGMAVAIAQQLKLPVIFVSYGEQVQQLSLFDPEMYLQTLLG